jgi:hypothetical protein
MTRALLLALAVVGLFAVPSAAQVNRSERTVPFHLDQATRLEAKVGPVAIDNVTITNLGRGFGRGGFGPKGWQPSEGSTMLRLAFDVNNPGEDWEVTFEIEFLDKAGKVIDRLTKKHGWKEEAQIYKVDHPILEYVLPMISDVKISLSGRVD